MVCVVIAWMFSWREEEGSKPDEELSCLPLLAFTIQSAKNCLHYFYCTTTAPAEMVTNSSFCLLIVFQGKYWLICFEGKSISSLLGEGDFLRFSDQELAWCVNRKKGFIVLLPNCYTTLPSSPTNSSYQRLISKPVGMVPKGVEEKEDVI